ISGGEMISERQRINFRHSYITERELDFPGALVSKVQLRDQCSHRAEHIRKKFQSHIEIKRCSLLPINASRGLWWTELRRGNRRCPHLLELSQPLDAATVSAKNVQRLDPGSGQQNNVVAKVIQV